MPDILTQARKDLETIRDVCHDEPELASRLERDLVTAALVATVYGDQWRAIELAKLALDAQQIPFRRV